ncbi:MAG: uncharacterized protein JWR80_7532 [Bradyrhizobium sp.]|nr:uncharacterized protein [Bradyrhizobium sp.]
MHKAEARVATPEAQSYLAELAHFWAYTYPVDYRDHSAKIRLPGVELVLKADATHLTVALEARDHAHFGHALALVASHVDRSVLPETGIPMTWHIVAARVPPKPRGPPA